MRSVAMSSRFERPVEVPRARRLGGYFVPARTLYAVTFPLIMMMAGVFCWAFDTDTMLAVGSSLLAVISMFLLFDLLVRQAPLRLSTLLATTLGLGYGLGTANTWFTLPRGDLPLGVYLHHDPAVLTHGMGSVLISLSILLSLGEIVEKPVFGEEFKLEFPPQVIVFISVGVAVIVLAYATHKLDYMGAIHSETGQLSVFSSFAFWLIGTLFAISVVAALNATSKALKRYLMVLIALQFLLLIPIGRRTLIYTVILAVLSLRLGRFRFTWSWIKKILVGGAIVGLLYVATIAFFYLRLAAFSKKNITIVDRVTLAWEYFQTKDYATVSRSFSQNVETRTFILGFLAEVESLSYKFTPGYGRDLSAQATAAIPSVLYPGKEILNEEGLSNELFGTTYGDEANSVLTTGAIDFGALGMIVYPILIVGGLRILVEILSESLPTFVAVFVIIGTIGRILEPENTVTDYFIIIRNGILFGTVVWFFIALPAFKLRKEVR